MSFLKEFWEFLRIRKKYWLIPILVVLVLFGGIIVGQVVLWHHLSTLFLVKSILGMSAFIMIVQRHL